MAQPLPYERDYDFEGFQSTHPSTPLPGDKVNLELDQVAETTDQIRNRIARLQDDDLALKRKSVGYDQLKDELNGFGFNPPAEWATATLYAARDTVFHNSAFYRCSLAHTSGTFAIDLAAGKWELVADFTAATTDAQTAATAAQAAQAAAESAKTTAVAAKESAITSAANAATSADSAALSEANAAASATAAAGSAGDADAAAGAAASSASNASNSATAAAGSATAAATSADDAAASAASIDATTLVRKTDTATTGFGFVIDEDDMASDSATKVPTQQSVKAKIDNDTILKVTDRTALKAVDTTKHTAAYLLESGREGQFVWDSSDLSTFVTADTAEGVYVAPASDPTGASGAWVREADGPVHISWMGASKTVGANNNSTLSSAMSGSRSDNEYRIIDGVYYLNQLVEANGGFLAFQPGGQLIRNSAGSALNANGAFLDHLAVKPVANTTKIVGFDKILLSDDNDYTAAIPGDEDGVGFRVNRYWNGTQDVAYRVFQHQRMYLEYGRYRFAADGTMPSGSIGGYTANFQVYHSTYGSTSGRSEVTPIAVGIVCAEGEDPLAPGTNYSQQRINLYNDIVIHGPSSSSQADREGFMAGISIISTKYAPGTTVDVNHAGSFGMTIFTAPGRGGFLNEARTGTAYEQIAGLNIAGWAGPTDGTASTGTAAGSNPAYTYGIRIGGIGGGVWADATSRSKIRTGIQINDYLEKGIHITESPFGADKPGLVVEAQAQFASISNVSKVVVSGYGTSLGFGMVFDAATDAAQPVQFRNSSDTPVGGITQTASAVAYNTTSDYRLKAIDGETEDAMILIRSVPIYDGRYLAEEPSGKRKFFLAHEVQAVAPYAVTGKKDALDEEGRVSPQFLDQSVLMPIVWAGLRELDARVSTLEGEK